MINDKVGVVDGSREEHKIAIAGAGKIGILLAEKLANQGYEVVLYNRPHDDNNPKSLAQYNERKEKIAEINKSAEGAITFTENLNEVKNCEIVHYIQGAQRSGDETRLDVFKKNAPTIANDIPIIAKNNPNAKLISTANPVDHMTRRIAEIINNDKFTPNIPVIGMGSSLDTTRFHDITKETLEKNGKNVNIKGGYVMGTHDDNMTLIFSDMTINDEPANSYLEKYQDKEYRYNTTQKAVVGEEINTADDDNIITIKGLKELITRKVKDRGAAIIKEGNGSDVVGPVEELVKMTNALTGKSDGYDTPTIAYNTAIMSQIPHGSELRHIDTKGAKLNEDIIEKRETIQMEESNEYALSQISLRDEYASLAEKKEEARSIA